jgi:hypothetical protein
MRSRRNTAAHPSTCLIFPRAESVTDEWLTTVICRQEPGARVLSYSLDKPDDGNTSRRRIFLSYNGAGEAAGLPIALFCKSLPDPKVVERPICCDSSVFAKRWDGS